MAQEIFTGPFHQVGRDPPWFIKYADETFLAKTFPVQDPALHGSKDYKEYFVREYMHLKPNVRESSRLSSAGRITTDARNR